MGQCKACLARIVSCKHLITWLNGALTRSACHPCQALARQGPAWPGTQPPKSGTAGANRASFLHCMITTRTPVLVDNQRGCGQRPHVPHLTVSSS